MIDPESFPDVREQCRELVVTEPAPDWGRMEQRLTVMFAEHHGSRAEPAASPLERLPQRGDTETWRVAAPTAAALLLAAAVAFYSPPSRPVPMPAPPPPVTPSAPPPNGGRPPVAGPAADISKSPSRRVDTPLRPMRGPVPNTVTSPARARPSATAFDNFVALPGAAALPDFESGRIVRIGMPIGALPAYGLDMVLDAAAATIAADLLIGQDGVPRAIRLAAAESH